MQLRDVQACIQALRSLAQINKHALIKESHLGVLVQTVVHDRDGLSDDRTGRAFANMLKSFFEFLTSKCATTPFFWKMFGLLQEGLGQLAEAVESRSKQARAQHNKVWDETDPERFNEELKDLVECYRDLEEVLAEPQMIEEAKKRLQSLAYSVRNAEKQLFKKIDSAVQVPQDWREAHEILSSLADRLEKRAAELGSTAESQGYPAAAA